MSVVDEEPLGLFMPREKHASGVSREVLWPVATAHFMDEAAEALIKWGPLA